MAEPSPNLLIGMRFVPRDYELLFLLLDRYNHGYTIPPELSVIIDESVYSTEPWKLKRNTSSYKLENEMYYFTMARRKSRGKKNNILERTAGNGYWHMNGQNIPIKYGNAVLGHKTALKYYHYDKNRHKVQTKWIMNEYRMKALSDDFDKPAELVLCRIQRTRTGSDIEEESSDFYNIAHHQAALPDQVQDPVNSNDWERPRSKRLRRDISNNNGTQYGSTNTDQVQMEHQHCYNTSTGIQDQYNQQQQQQCNNTKSTVPDQHEEDYQQQCLDTGMENSTVKQLCSDMQHASEAGNEKGNALGDDWLAMIDVPSPNVLLPFPDDVFKLGDHDFQHTLLCPL
ncbi:NAC domain-containing protein [Dioscorea alata]|uniref:NAC domain-containing protein n=1 Tax=Dioscorea alata TaxID=55571 RepID=A0ACB7UAT3_DIOAL|nr:NAC domain-containing protein [Dioscorea alata]